MFLDFLYALRRRGVPVGTQEALNLAQALAGGLHDSSLDGFYAVARALLVHSEAHLDPFDQAFGEHFRGVAAQAVELTDELLSWLGEQRKRRDLSPEELAAIEELDLEEVLRRFRERLREQKERHDGGSHWIGTGGTSPFGRGGFHPSGIRVGPPGGGRGGALRDAQARRYRGYRGDVTLDTRQMEVALRKLRGFGREGGAPELDVDATIAATARNAGELELVVAPPKRPNTRVVLMMDVGGSMDPYTELVSQLFSAAKRATHWKELRTYYFHNCVYDLVYRNERFEDPVRLDELLRECDDRYRLVLLGDAAMAPYELHGTYARRGQETRTGFDSLLALRNHFPRACWLNPEDAGEGRRYGTCAEIGALFPMFPLTLDGLGEAVGALTRGGPHRAGGRV